VIRNNIVYQMNPAAPYVLNQSLAADGIYGANNLFFGIGAAPSGAYTTESLNIDPRFVNLWKKDFHLTAASPARGRGSDTGICCDMDGVAHGGSSGRDLGAFQFRRLDDASGKTQSATHVSPCTGPLEVNLSVGVSLPGSLKRP
jgi:hypothetical protein